MACHVPLQFSIFLPFKQYSYFFCYVSEYAPVITKSWQISTVNADIFARLIFRVINFSRFAAQKHIRGLLNSRWADAHLSFLYCTINYHSMNDTFTSMYVTGQHKNKQITDRLESYYPFASTHMVNTQLLRVPKCA